MPRRDQREYMIHNALPYSKHDREGIFRSRGRMDHARAYARSMMHASDGSGGANATATDSQSVSDGDDEPSSSPCYHKQVPVPVRCHARRASV